MELCTFQKIGLKNLDTFRWTCNLRLSRQCDAQGGSDTHRHALRSRLAEIVGELHSKGASE